MNNYELNMPASGQHHLESHHADNETVFCLIHNGECGVTVSIHANIAERAILEPALMAGIKQIDLFFNGRFGELFKGLRIVIGDGITEGGGEAFGEQNRIVLDRQKMLMSIQEEDAFLAQRGWADPGDRLRAVPEEMHDMSAVFYEVVHETGHILEERASLQLSKELRMNRAAGLADKSPTNLYKKDPSKPHEAFAEGFAYMVLGQQIDPELKAVINRTIEEFDQ